MNKLNGKPTTDGWYWYHDPERNFAKPMPAWVFFNSSRGYATLCAVHESPRPDHVMSLDELRGTWVGPMETPS